MPAVPPGLLPAYLAEIFGDLYERDGLAVLGKGLLADMLLAAFCRFYSIEDNEDEKGKIEKRKTVLILGLHKDTERELLLDILTSWGTPPGDLPTVLTNEAGQAKEREALYAQGGVFCITSRILIVDLLTKTIESSQIDGILVGKAHAVTEQSTEAFCLRIIQSQRSMKGLPRAFCKAITDNPLSTHQGFAKVDKILKALRVQHLHLLPRFHDVVRKELESTPPKVIELHQQLTSKQKEMQYSIAAAVQTCLRELKASTPLLASTEDWKVEHIVTTSNWDQTISRQLDAEWHRLSPKTKQLVQDLRTLRTLFSNLLLYDCVTFYKFLQSLQSWSAASKHSSLWLLTPAADELFKQAKERVYTMERVDEGEGNIITKCRPVLEANPKWRLLRQVLTEIRNEDKPSPEPRNILVLTKDDRTLTSFSEYLTKGTRSLWMRWLRYLEDCNDRSRSVVDSEKGTAAISEEARLLLEEEGRARRVLFGESSQPKTKRNDTKKERRKRRKIAQEQARGVQDQDDLDREEALKEAVNQAEANIDESVTDENSDIFHDDRFNASFGDELRVVVKSFAGLCGDESLMLLHDLKPTHVVLYDVDLAFVRAIEIFSAIRASESPLKVYFLIFKASAEEKSFLKTLEREKEAFEKLIHHKKTMPPPAIHDSTTTQELRYAMEEGCVESTYMNGTLPLSMDTRTGRGKLNTSKERRDVAVDVREFRSALPSILHQGGMRLAPATLTVGDFVLSNAHCIERKSISDLFGSFASGRLYTQAEAMVKHYKVPCLLIEFDPTKAFCLQNENQLGPEVKTDSVCSKIALLTMHFPQLRLLWTRGPHETLKLFRDLKKNHDEVDVSRTIDVGRNETEEALLHPEDKDSDDVNETAREMLLRLPGVNVHSARRIMERCDSIAELCSLSREDLRKIVGPSAGQKLFTFLHRKMD